MTTPTQQASTIRKGDIFRFRYSDEERAKRFMPDHCFDGQLVAFQRDDGSIYLKDTYWSGFTSRSDGTCFSPEEAGRLGELTFVCNVYDVQEIRKDQTVYYAESDVFDLSYQHHCYPYYVVRKGAQRDRERMLAVIAERIADKKREIESLDRGIIWLESMRALCDEGKLDEVYL